MSQRTHLKNLLAQIELDRRQVQLEKREREVEFDKRELELDRKRREYENQLTQINIVDLTSDEAQVKPELAGDNSQIWSPMTQAIVPAAEDPAMTMLINGTTVDEGTEEQTITGFRPQNSNQPVHHDISYVAANGKSPRLVHMFEKLRLTIF